MVNTQSDSLAMLIASNNINNINNSSSKLVYNVGVKLSNIKVNFRNSKQSDGRRQQGGGGLVDKPPSSASRGLPKGQEVISQSGPSLPGWCGREDLCASWTKKLVSAHSGWLRRVSKLGGS